MKVVVLNLDKSVDRMEKIGSQLNRLNISYERFSAIDGKSLTDIDEEAHWICGNLLCNYGMVGCALSHIQIWKDFLKSKDDFICVMEDDIKISAEFPEFLKNINKIYSEIGFDMISLYCSGVCSGEQISVGEYSFVRPKFPLGAVCYVLSRTGAEKIITKLDNKIMYHIDFVLAFDMLFNSLNYNILIDPKLIDIENGESTLGTNGSSLIINLVDPKYSWILNVPLFSIRYKYTISIYMAVLFIVLLICILKKWYILFSVIFTEFSILIYTSKILN